MATFDPDYRSMMFTAYGGRCGVSFKQATQAHHIKPNTKINMKRWPLYIQSPFNLMPINHDTHMTQPLPEAPSDRVCDVFEHYLQKNKGE